MKMARQRQCQMVFRRLSTLTRRRRLMEEVDEGDWFYSSEWWGSDSDHFSHSIFRSSSLHGNGVVSVLSHPSSRPKATDFPKAESWLHKRCMEICPGDQLCQDLKVLGYEWRVLRFNDITRQSTAKVMVASKMSDPGSIHYMQQGNCLAVPYIKSMLSSGLTALSSCNYDLLNAVHGKRKLQVLCVGHGGGTLPLFLASKIQGAVIDIVEIDPLVISASINVMGFPSFSVVNPLGHHAISKPNTMDEIFWGGVHERLFLFESDAEKFIINTENQYDIIFIDAYDGDDIFPHKFWGPNSPFLKALSNRLHPHHGTVVVNVHSDTDLLSPDALITSNNQSLLPMGKYVSGVCRAYKDIVDGVAFAVSVPWVYNATLVVCRGFGMSSGVSYLSQQNVQNILISKSLEIERELHLPFSCEQYLNGGFVLLD